MNPTLLCQISEVWVDSYISLNGNAAVASMDTRFLYEDMPRLRSRKAFLAWLLGHGGLAELDAEKLEAFVSLYVGFECELLVSSAFSHSSSRSPSAQLLKL